MCLLDIICWYHRFYKQVIIMMSPKVFSKFKYFLGIKVIRFNYDIVIFQRKYSLNILMKIMFMNSKSVNTIMDPNIKLLPNHIFLVVKFFQVIIKSKFFYGLNMFLVPQVSAKFKISLSSKLLTNLVLHLSKCMNLVLLTKFC